MKKPKAPKLVTVAVTTTITIIFWIFFTLYQVLTTKPTPSVDQSLLEPLNPNLDTAALATLRDKVFFEEGSFQLPETNPEENLPEPTEALNNIPTETPLPTEVPSDEDS